MAFNVVVDNPLASALIYNQYHARMACRAQHLGVGCSFRSCVREANEWIIQLPLVNVVRPCCRVAEKPSGSPPWRLVKPGSLHNPVARACQSTLPGLPRAARPSGRSAEGVYFCWAPRASLVASPFSLRGEQVEQVEPGGLEEPGKFILVST